MKKPITRAPGTREDKIKLLLDINAGKLTIDDALPGKKKVKIWNLRDGIYQSNTGIIMSEDEFQKKPKSAVIDVVVIRRKPELPSN